MFDLRDPHDAAALYDMWFNCSNCIETFNYEPGGAINLAYYHQIGQAAKKAGWAVDIMGSGGAAERSYQMYCPQCASKLAQEKPARNVGLELQVALVADLLNG